MTGQQVVFQDKAMGFAPHLQAFFRVGQQLPDAQCGPFRRVDQKAGVVVEHLQADTAGIAADYRP